MEIQYLTMKEFRDGLQKTKTILIPFGSVEAHGTHLPLGTDTLHVYELCRNVSKEIPVFVAPPLYYGLCRSTSRHAGTVGISGMTLRALTMDLLTSFYLQGLRNFILISGHAGKTHISYIVDAGEEFIYKFTDTKLAVLTVLDLPLPDDLIETKGDSHAGELETSVMMCIDPKLIKDTCIEDYPAFPRYILVRDKERFWKTSIWGNPTKASPEKGFKILEAEKLQLIRLIRELEEIEV